MADWGVRRFLKAMTAHTGARVSVADPAAIRRTVAAIAALNGPGPAMASVYDHRIARPGGELVIRELRPTERPLGRLVFLPDGGWVAGDLDTADTVARKLAERCACTVLVPAYRRAPEEPFPAAVEDARLAMSWARERADGTPLLLAGVGAGGGLAAAVAGAGLDLLVLVQPVLDTRVADAGAEAGAEADDPESRLVADVCGWYVPDPADRSRPDASPVLRDDLSGHPPTLVLAAGRPLLREQALTHAKRLAAAGVPVDVHEFDTVAGFFDILTLFDSERAFQRIVHTVRSVLAGPHVAAGR